MTQLLHFARLPKPMGGVLSFAAVFAFAWVGGFRPALFIAPVLLFLARLTRNEADRWSAMTSEEMVGFAVVTLLAALTGLVGQYQRRVRSMTKRHAQKLEDQARALNQAAIVYRGNDGRITEWSAGAERLCGWTADEARGQDLHELLERRLPEPDSVIDDAMSRSGQWQGEVICRHKSGAELHVATHWILYGDHDDQSIGVAEVWNDVTALRRAEAAIRDADRRKDEFLAMLAHEIRNPLSPIRTGLGLLALIREDETQFTATREMMERQMTHLVAILDDLLDVSRITCGKFQLRCTRVVLGDVISSAVETVASTIENAGHTLTVALPPRPIYMHADPSRLGQAVSNLLDNAVKYTPRGGQIGVTVSREGNEVELSVVDNGIGIPAEILGSVFDMFKRGTPLGEAANSGLGIGLALVKSIVEMHGGTVSVRSGGEGRGAEFVVRLPALADSSAVEDGQRPLDGAKNRDARRVLIVDDHIDSVKLLSIVVKKLGNEVRVAYDGLEAIAVAEQFLPEIVILDIGMPKLDGYGTARHIRQQPWGKDIVLIALTGWGQDADKKQAEAAGFDHHLVKPANPNELGRLLSNGHRLNGFAQNGAATVQLNKW